MASFTKSQLNYMMKIYYTSGYNEDCIYHDNKVLKPLFENRDFGGGVQVQGPYKEAYGHSTHGIAETGQLPTAAAGKGFNWYDNLKIVPTRKDISQLIINISKGKQYAYEEALDTCVKEAQGEHGDYMYKYLFNSGGYLAQCESCPSNVTLKLVAGTNMDLFEPGMTISVLNKTDGDATNGVNAGISVISAVNKATRVITIAGDTFDNYASVDTTEWVCIYGDVSGTTSYIPHGFPDLIGDATTGPAILHNVTIASDPKFVSYVLDREGNDVNAENMQQVIDEIELHSKGEVSMVLCSDAFRRRAQFDLCEPQQWRSPEDSVIGVGDPKLRVASKRIIPLKVAAYCQPKDDVYFLDTNPEAFTVYHAAWMDWMDDDGNYIFRVPDYYKYEMTLSTEYQLVAKGRRRLGKIINANIASL